MYNVKTRQFLVEIPKNGSRSLVQTMTTRYGKVFMKSHGHHSVRHFCDDAMFYQVHESRWPINPFQVIVVYRNPVDRLLSQVNHAMRNKQLTFNEAMAIAWHQSDIVFMPQWKFVELPTSGEWEFDWRAWPMERINEAMSFIMGCTVGTHLNNSEGKPQPVNMDQLIEHKLFDDLMESPDHYKLDYKLWLDADKRKKDGKLAV